MVKHLLFIAAAILLLSSVQAITTKCQFTEYADLIRGYSLGLCNNPVDLTSDCYLKSDIVANKLELLYYSIIHLSFTSYMDPLSYSNQLIVGLSDQSVACGYTTMIQQFSTRISLAGLYEVLSTILYSIFFQNSLNSAILDLYYQDNECIDIGYDIGIILSVLLNYVAPYSVQYSSIQSFTYDTPSSASLEI